MSLSREDIDQHVVRLISEMFEIEAGDIVDDANLYEDLDIDSIDAVDLIVELKNLTGKKIAPEDFKNVRTVADVKQAVDQLVNG